MKDIEKHIERMMKPYREIVKTIEPIMQIQEQSVKQSRVIQKAINPTIELQEKLIEPLRGFHKYLEKISKIYTSIPEFHNSFLEHLETFKEIGERLKEYTKNTPKNFLLIAQHGWFIDMESELSFPSVVAEAYKNKKNDDANALLTDYYRANIDEIFKSLIKRHHNRKEILEDIKSSFEESKFTLTVPATLTQVDGICFDFTKKKFFIKEKRDINNKWLPEVVVELEKSAGNFLELYLSPLKNQTPIMAREIDIGKFPCNLNRHEILHGTRVDYGTEINCLKVISLLKYVSDLLTDLDKKNLNETVSN